MNEKSDAKGLNNGASPRGCGSAEELVAYLYGEATPDEAKAFRQHLTGCAACRDELAAFGGVREAVGEWRAEALSAVPPLNIEEALTPLVGPAPLAPERKRSAAAALREFFSLSPLWLQAGAAAAALVVCALAALTLARTEVRWDASGLAFRTGVHERVVEKERVVQVPVQTGYTQEQVDAIVKENVDREVAAEHAKWEAENQRVNVLEAALKQQRLATRNATTLVRQQSPRRSAPGTSRGTQLARENEDYFSPREERGVPHLTDLLGAVNTPR
jgi:anti-sigma factor RsiW